MLAGDSWQELALTKVDGQPADINAAFQYWEQHAPNPASERDDDTASEPDEHPSTPSVDGGDDHALEADTSAPRCNFQVWLETLGFTAAPLVVAMHRNQTLRHVHIWRHDQDEIFLFIFTKPRHNRILYILHLITCVS